MSSSSPLCPLCNADTQLLYTGLRDELFGASGSWDLHQCKDQACTLVSIQPPPSSAATLAAYETYYTHAQTANSLPRWLTSLWHSIRAHFQSRHFGYEVTSTIQSANLTIRVAGRLLSYLLPLLPGRAADLKAGVCYLAAPKKSDTAQLLEVGCGSGKILHHMQTVGWQVTGTDFDEKAVEQAQQQGLAVLHGPLASQDFRGQQFDAIVLKHVIEHVPDPIAELTLCRSLLKPTGTLVIMTPNLAGRGHRRWRQHWRGLEPPRHLQLYGPQSLARTLKQAGFVGELSTTGRTRTATIASINTERRNQGMKELPRGLALIRGELDEYLEALSLIRDPLNGNELLAIARPNPNLKQA